MSRLLALNSPAPQSGKTEFAKVAIERFGYTSIPFAKPVKDMLKTLLENLYSPDVVNKMLYGEWKGHTLMDLERTPRELMQTLGTEWGRQLVNPNLWVMLWTKQVEASLKEGKKVICDDMRFPNEFNAVVRLDGYTVYIERPGASTNGHKSEGQLSNHQFDTTMFNTRDLSDWNRYCQEILSFYEVTQG